MTVHQMDFQWHIHRWCVPFYEGALDIICSILNVFSISLSVYCVRVHPCSARSLLTTIREGETVRTTYVLVEGLNAKYRLIAQSHPFDCTEGGYRKIIQHVIKTVRTRLILRISLLLIHSNGYWISCLHDHIVVSGGRFNNIISMLLSNNRSNKR